MKRILPQTIGGWGLIGLVIAIAIGGVVAVWQTIPKDPAEHSAEAGFLRDMQTHHTQAITMAMAIRDRTDDEQLKALATDIAFAQAGEIGKMQGYLDSWDLPFSGTDTPMAWMGMPLADGELMPGMATDEQIAQLSSLPVDEAEVLFLQLMIRHHQGGVEMAEAILQRSDNDLVTTYANQVVRVQSQEIDTMNAMLEERGADPITDPLPTSHNHGS